MENGIKIFTFDEIVATEIKWLWKPYIAFGKITVVQGDPGTGKTSLALAIAALVSSNRRMPTGHAKAINGHVIFQSGEDSPKDIIKPRLVACKADCTKISFMESDCGLSLNDFEEVVINLNAKLVIIDPLQAFLTLNQDITSVKNMRPLLRDLGHVAERTGAAIIIIGHMNKNDRAKGIYRGLGSIDIAAAARSVLLVGKRKNDENMRFMTQIKNNLAGFGKTIGFSINPLGGVEFHGECDIAEDELLSDNGNKKLKHHVAEDIIISMLAGGDKKSNEIFDACIQAGVSPSVMSYIKRKFQIKSVRKIDDWYWTLDASAMDTDESPDEAPVVYVDEIPPSQWLALGKIKPLDWKVGHP